MWRLGTLAIFAVALNGFASVVQAGPGYLGKHEYEQNCATCHGASGKGDGPLAGYLTVSPPDLTKIMEKNNGVFPTTLVMETIDGRRSYAVHGTRDMPAWGNEFDQKAADYYEDFTDPYNPESFIRSRVLALTEYIFELQERK